MRDPTGLTKTCTLTPALCLSGPPVCFYFTSRETEAQGSVPCLKSHTACSEQQENSGVLVYDPFLEFVEID